MNWPALILAPLLALGNLALTFALVTPSCARQDRVLLSAVNVAVLAVCLFLTWLAARNLRARPRAARGDAASESGRFLALVATLAGLLSSLVVLAMWFPNWVLSPCAN
jgi:hydrogenase-4 membrane subunit HyfE